MKSILRVILVDDREVVRLGLRTLLEELCWVQVVAEAGSAEELSLSEKTVRNHVSAILAKLNLTNRIEAAIYAVRHDIEHHMPGRS